MRHCHVSLHAVLTREQKAFVLLALLQHAVLSWKRSAVGHMIQTQACSAVGGGLSQTVPIPLPIRTGGASFSVLTGR